MDPFRGLAEFLLGKIKEGLWAQWLRFLFELGFSAIFSFCFICGFSLAIAQAPAGMSIGAGLMASAISATALFRRESSKLTKGMLVILPSAEAAKELESNLQTIEKK